MSVRKKILLIDADRDVLCAMKILLELEGYEVCWACSCGDAIEVVTTFIPDVALVDENIPQMGGLELAGILLQNPTLRGMRLIALSRVGHIAAVQKSKDAGFDLHLTKPVSLDDVIAAIEGK